MHEHHRKNHRAEQEPEDNLVLVQPCGLQTPGEFVRLIQVTELVYSRDSRRASPPSSQPRVYTPLTSRASQIAQLVKNPPAMQENLVQFLGQEDPLEKG